MQFANTTPFPALCFESTVPDGSSIHTVVVRATATIIPGAPLSFSEVQLPLRLTDCYFGDPGTSSLKYPSDLAPFKPKADIILIATAYSPAEQSPGWKVEVSVGQNKKSLAVIGDCVWEKSFLHGWQLSPITPVKQVSLRYENAYGGRLTVPDERNELRTVDACHNNPVGRGWLSPLAPKLLGENTTFPMAQIFAPDHVSMEFGREYSVEGFGPIAPQWGFRQRRIGSWPESDGDEAKMPSDFDFLYYNSAHPDLIVPYLNGEEDVQLLGLSTDGTLNFKLPGYSVHVVSTYSQQCGPEIVPAVLDTLVIEPDDMRVSLVWRATVPVDSDVESLVAQLALNADSGYVVADHE